MPDLLFHETASANEGGVSGEIMVYSEFDDERSEGELTIEVQVLGVAPRGEEHGSARIILPLRPQTTTKVMSLQSEALYAACIVAQVGTKAWADYEKCRDQAKQNKPNAGAGEIWKNALECLKAGSGGVAAVFATASTACSFLL